MARTMVGLDIGGSGVRAAEFVLGRRASLRRFAGVPLPEGVVRSGLVVDPDALTAALKDLWQVGKFGSKEVVVGVANASVLVRQMDLEWMPPADFRKGLRYQVADALPVPVDEANLDYYMLDEIDQPGDQPGDQPAKDTDQPRRVARVLLVAAGRDMVDGFVRPVQAAGLRPVRVDLLPFALVRAACPVQDSASPLEAIVDIGADTVVVVVHQGGRPRFVRTLSGHGGETLTRSLMERYDWTWEDAERTKIVLGHPSEGAERHPAHDLIAEHVDRLVTELRATLAYFRTSAGSEESLSRLVLTGRAALLGGLDERLRERLDLPVETLSIAERIRTPRKLSLDVGDQAALTMPAGLCLWAAS